MNSYRLTPAHWDGVQAETYISELRAAVERIAEDPDRGRACDDIREGYRRYCIGSHLIFYRVAADSVDVIRILHQRMDPSRHM